MNSKKLALKIAKSLNIPEAKSNLVFSIFKEKMLEFLNVGEALKIDGLGIFQLKEQIRHSGSAKVLEPKSKDLTLVYSPSGEEGSGDFLFIKLDETERDETEFDENVFQIGIGKSLVTDSDESSENITEGDDRSGIEKSISILFNDSEKFKDFDLWEDHLKSKETKSLLEDENDNTLESTGLEKESEIFHLDEEGIESNGEDILKEEFEPLNEEELLEDYAKNNGLISEESSDATEELKIDNVDSKDFLDELVEEGVRLEKTEELNTPTEKTSNEKHDEKSEETVDSEKTEVNESNLKIDEDEQKDNIELVEEKIDDELIVEIEDHGEEKVSLVEDVENGDESHEKSSSKKEIESSDVNDAVEEELVLENTEEMDSKSVHQEKVQPANDADNKRNNKGLVFVLISAFIIIAAISSYYLFLDDSMVYDKSEVPSSSDETVTELTDEDFPGGEESINNVASETPNEQSSDPNDIDQKSKIENNNISETTLTTNNQQLKENEVSQNIFYNGESYNIQVSSWKQKNIADSEAQKLVNRGYPAFTLKVYIPKFDGTWHRVRVGPYKSLNEAKAVQQKL